MLRFWTSVLRKAKGRHVLIIFSLAIVSLLYATQTALSTIPIPKFLNLTLNYPPSASPKFQSAAPVTLVLILCKNDSSGHAGKSEWDDMSGNFQRQINQTVVLLKSVVVQEAYFRASSRVPLEVLVLSDRSESLRQLDEAIREDKWAAEFRGRIHLTFVPVDYPAGSEWMRSLFRPCATLRLFLDQLLPSYDSLIYMDTDFICLRPISELWSEFHGFSPENLAAIAPCLHHYGTPANSIPFYGESGLNAGVMLMNLTRIRRSNWTLKIRQITQDFLKQIQFADQDILNIYFNATPSELHVLGCDWNFRPQQCQKEGFCLDGQIVNGISALHGNGVAFEEVGTEPVFRAVFSALQRYNLTSSSQLKGLTSSLKQEVRRAQEKNKSPCALYKHFPKLLLNRMNSGSRAPKHNTLKKKLRSNKTLIPL